MGAFLRSLFYCFCLYSFTALSYLLIVFFLLSAIYTFTETKYITMEQTAIQQAIALILEDMNSPHTQGYMSACEANLAILNSLLPVEKKQISEACGNGILRAIKYLTKINLITKKHKKNG